MACNLLKAREKSRLPGAIGFGFASHWLKNWPITKRSKSQSRYYFRQSFQNCSDTNCWDNACIYGPSGSKIGQFCEL